MIAELRQGVIKHFEKLLLFLLVAAWVALYSWRPLYLGFYHDDWSLLVAPLHLLDIPSFSTILAEHPDRPLYATFRWLFLKAWNKETWTFQATALAVVTLGALQLYHLGKELNRRYFGSSSIPVVMPAVYLCASWTHGFTIFGSAVVALTCLLFFTASCIFNIRYVENQGTAHLLGYAVTLCCSLLAYQSFMLSNLVVCLFIAICSRYRDRTRGNITRNATILVVTVLVTLALVLLTKGESPKSISFNAGLLLHNFKMVPDILLMKGQYDVFAPVGTLLQFTVVLLLIGYLKSGDRRSLHLLIVLFCIASLGTLVSTIPYSLAGYGISSIGVFSRTTLPLTFWTALGAGLVAAVMERMPTLPLKSAAAVTGIGILVLHGMVNHHRTKGWIRSWEIQQKVIAGLPAAELSKLPCGRTVVLINAPVAVDGVEVFAAPWDIGGAIQSRYPEISSGCKDGNARVYATYKSTHWDGSSFTLVPNWTVPADHVYSVDYRTGRVETIKAPY